VIGTASRAKHDFVRGLGADELIDYRVTDFVAAVKDVDVAFDLVGRDYGARSIEVLRQGGLLVTIDRTNASVAALLRPLRSATPVSPSSQITSGSTRWPRWWQTESCESMWTRCFRSRRRPAPMRCSPEAAQPAKSS
jgi:NADPH:quinone reductase-like Zn-dependent oxidoreductase